MVNVLHIVSGLSGGVGRMLLNYYSNMDKSIFRFDFVVHGFDNTVFEDTFKAFGSEVTHVTPKKVSPVKNFLEIFKAIHSKKYDIVYAHQNFSSAPALIAAWLCGVKVRICHSHGCVKNADRSFSASLMRLLIHIFATDFYACSKEAGKYLFGSKWDEKDNVILNAFDIDLYRYNPDTAKKMREQFGIGDGRVFLQVGRMSREKNPFFSLNLFDRIYAEDKNAHIFFIGKGKLCESLKETALNMECKKNVHFVDETEDIYSYYSLGDILLMPSLDEGFGMTAVEAQVAGEYVLASDAVSVSTQISNNIRYLPLDDMAAWEKAVQSADTTHDRHTEVGDGFSIFKQVKLFEKKLLAKVNPDR